MTPIEKVLERLPNARRAGDGWEASCPLSSNHRNGDRKRSLGIAVGRNDCVLVRCYKDCPTDDVVKSLGLEVRDLFAQVGGDEWTPRGPAVATYLYSAEDGSTLFGVCRTADKQFPQWHPDTTSRSGRRWNLNGVRRVLYRLPEVRKCAEAHGHLIVVEGEKDVDRLVKLGFTATCNPGGAKKWRAEFCDQVAGVGEIAILPDNDEDGREHAAKVARSVAGVVPKVKVIELPDLPEKGDLSDWLAAGHTVEELVALLNEAPEWEPEPEERHDSPETANSKSWRSSEEVGVLRRKVVMLTAADARPEPVHWLWDGRLALGSLNLVVGPPSTNKSTLTTELAARLSKGQLQGDLYGTPANTIIASAEDSIRHTILPRLIATGADLDRIFFISVMTDETEIETNIVLPEDLDALREQVIAKEAALAIVDPFTAFLTAEINSHRDQDIRRALAPLARLADDTGCAALPIVHTNKSSTTDFYEKTGGSIGITAAARSSLLVTRDPEDQEGGPSRVIVHAKCNIAPETSTLRFRVESRQFNNDDGDLIHAAGIAWTGEANVTAREALKQQDDEERSALEEAMDVLTDILRNGPVKANEGKRLATEAGIASRTLDRARKRLGIAHKQGAPGERDQGWIWALPEERQTSEERQQTTKNAKFSDKETVGGLRGFPVERNDDQPYVANSTSGNGASQGSWTFGNKTPCEVCGGDVFGRDENGVARHPGCVPRVVR